MPADRRTADLLSVLEISRELAARPELQPLLEAIEQAALRVVDCERASVFLHDPARDDLVSRVATGVTEIRFPAGQGLAGQAFRSGMLINLPDAYADPQFNPDFDRRTGFVTRSLLTCPLLDWNNVPIGVLQVLNKRTGAFDAWDEVLVRTLSAQAGIAVQRQLLLTEFALKQRFERDLAVARKIQQDLLPRTAPALPGFDLAGWNQPADETGGDFFDFVSLDDGRLLLTLGDVTGHGIGPALVAAECRALIRAGVQAERDLGPLVTGVNRLLADDLPEGRFATAFFGLFDPRTARVRYLSAGQAPVLLFEAKSRSVRSLPAHGVPLGALPNFAYKRHDELTLAPGDILVVLSDGFAEWPDGRGERGGSAPLAEVLRQEHTRGAAALVQLLYEAVRTKAGGTPQDDDLTAIVLRRAAAA